MYGAIIGDVVGSQYEFDNIKTKVFELFTDKCSFYEVPIVICASKEELGHAIGKVSRASVAVTDQGLADAIAKYFDRNDMEVVECQK